MINLYTPKITNEDKKAVASVLNKNWLSGNTEIVEKFENKIAKYCETKYALACSSGTTALHLALISTGLKEDDEVIMPSLTYIASANSVKYFGGKPVFIDINKSDWQMDTSEIENKITNKTKAILPVHLYGGIPNLTEILKISKNYNLKVIHDCAESLGSFYKNKHSSSFKDVGVHSFFPNKLITTGEGGLLVTNNSKIYNLAKKLRSQGLKGKIEYDHDVIGYNYRMPAMSAALGLSQLKSIETSLNKKIDIFNQYKKNFEGQDITLQETPDDIRSSYWLTVIMVRSEQTRNRLQKYLYSNNIETRRAFKPLHLQKPYYIETENLSNSVEFGKRSLCLPSSPNLSNKDINYISEKINNFLKD